MPSYLANYKTPVRPRSLPRGHLVITALIFISAIGVSALGFLTPPNRTQYFKLGGLLFLLSVAVLFLETFYKKFRIQVALWKIQPALLELQSLFSFLSLYLEEFDFRTAPYFELVTTSKVATYFMLRELHQSLDRLLKEVEALKESPSRETYERLDEILQGELPFRDGLEIAKSRIHSCPIKTLAMQLNKFIEELESAAKKLEAEINIPK